MLSPRNIVPGLYRTDFHDGNTTTEKFHIDVAPQTVNLRGKRSLLNTGGAKCAQQLTKRDSFVGTGWVMVEYD